MAPEPLDGITDKIYFRIGEVGEIVGVPTYVLRYWETEFSLIRPQKSHSKQRVYRRKDVENLLKIKHLLYAQKFTIAGARDQLKENLQNVALAKPASEYVLRKSLEKIRAQVNELIELVNYSENSDINRDADPAGYVRGMGGGREIFALRNKGSSRLVQRTPRK